MAPRHVAPGLGATYCGARLFVENWGRNGFDGDVDVLVA